MNKYGELFMTNVNGEFKRSFSVFLLKIILDFFFSLCNEYTQDADVYFKIHR